MAKYLRKYNKETGKWEIISPTSTDDIAVSNTSFNDKTTPITKLTNVLNDISNDINQLKRNVSWLAEHGGGGGVGVGGGAGSSYKIMNLTSGMKNDVLYVNGSKFTVIFKITGGSVNDYVEYRVIYDGNYLTNNFNKTKVNTNLSVTIDNIEKYSQVTPHTMVIEAVDANGMTIPPYTISIVETSMKINCSSTNILTIGGEGFFNVFVTNKILNATTSIKVINTSSEDRVYDYTYISNSVEEKLITIDFYEHLVNAAQVGVGHIYKLRIEGQTTTPDGITIDAAPIYTDIMIQGSSAIVINLDAMTTAEEYDADINKGSEFAIGGNIVFGFTPYLTDNIVIYYAVCLESENGEIKENIVGNYDGLYNSNPTMQTGKLKTISWYVPNESYKGTWLVKVKCWSSTGLIEKEVIGKCRIIDANTEIFPTQIPIRGNLATKGNTQYGYWDITNMPSISTSTQWPSRITSYLAPNANENNESSITTVMNVFNTNGEENGFLTTPSPRLRLSSEAYATIDTDISTDWANKDGFTISLTFKTDFHPYNNRTVFFLGNLDSKGDFYNGMKIDLENVYWYFQSQNDKDNVQQKMIVPIAQHATTTVDFVYMHKQSSSSGHEGIAKIFINGKIYKAVEANIYKSDIPSKIYLGCAYSNSKGTHNYADVDITSLRIFSKYLNDMEVVVNSHNARASRNERNEIIESEYTEWKKKNFFEANDTNVPNSSIYKLISNQYQYTCPGYANLIGNNPPLPVLWLDGRQSKFKRDIYESTSNDANITKVQYDGFVMKYYDPNAVNKEVQCDDLAVSIQGTSTTTLRSKNLEIYFTKELEGYTDGRTQLFQPREDWFPEAQFTLKADVVDSAHANNAVLGRWINTEAAKTILEDTPPMTIVKQNPPKDAVQDIDGSIKEFESRQTIPTVKHTLEGFPIILMITFSGEEAPEMLGIYSFNLGRYSYYNMGLKFFKSFSRRDYDVTSGEWVEKAAPSLINNYEFYDKTETITSTSERINLNEVFSYEFGADADDNTDTHNTWSQDDLSIIKHIGSFKYNGVNGDDSAPTDAVWETLSRVFYATARMPDVREIYHYDGKNYVPTGEYYNEALDMSTEYMLKRLSIKNTISYFIIANAFGMVDSLGKNLTLRSWNAQYNNIDDDADNNKWYPCFYDMDTALGLTNAGEESVVSTVYMDEYANDIIDESNIKPNNLIITRNKQQNKGFGAYNSKLWNILRSTMEDGKTPSRFVSTGKWQGDLYESTWRKLRQEGGPLNSPDLFIDLFTEQTKDCGELLYNLDYNTKYLVKYLKSLYDDAGNETEKIFTYGNIEMLHGDRVEYIRTWLRDRLFFLDGVFEVQNTTADSVPYYRKGYITCGGPAGGGYPRLTFNSTSPVILTTEIGQNGQIYKYFLPAYQDTEVIMPHLSSDSKRIGINATTLLTKIDGLKDIRFEKFESMHLPKFSQLDLNNITTLSDTNPVEFASVFVSSEDGKLVSHMRDINLYNTKGSSQFAVTITNYNKIKKVDIRNSCVTSMSLPSTPLSELQFSNSEITNVSINNQPYLNNLDFTGCHKLQNIELNNCNNIGQIDINGLELVNNVTITACDKIEKINCCNNLELREFTLEGLNNLKEINLSGSTNTELKITIKGCPSLQKIILKGVQSTEHIILPTDVSNVTLLNLENCTNIKAFKFGDSSTPIETYNGEPVLDLRKFTNLRGTNLTLKNCGNIKYIKFNNLQNTPYELATSFFTGCSSLINVFGHVSIKGNSVFKDCTQFFIHELPADAVTPMPEEGVFIASDDSNKGNVTNITINTTDLSSCFYQTSCNLYDVYYILQKCDDVTSLNSTFAFCTNVVSTVRNSLNRNIFKHCGKVTTMASLFYASNVGGILKSPVINSNGSITEYGILSPCISLQNANYIFSSSASNCYIDENFFYKGINGQNLPITSIQYFSPKTVTNTNASDVVNKIESNNLGTISSSKLFTYLDKLSSIYYSFSNGRYKFVDTINIQGTYSTDLFYNNTALVSIEGSFRNIYGEGNLRNLFGGYEATRNLSDHFPKSLTTIAYSFHITSGAVNMFIGNSFLQRISNSIQYITGEKKGTNVETSISSFSGSGLKKKIDQEGNTKTVFPYEIFKGCSNLKECCAFFMGLEGNTNNVITLPIYENDYNEEKSMFEDTTSLLNISYLFSEMKNIKYRLKGGAFKNCKLINVSHAFSESAANNNITGNKEGKIPYGLFLQETQNQYTKVSGLTEETALSLGIDETYGLKEGCQFDSSGKVIVKFDEDGVLVSGGTYPDGDIIQHAIDERGYILDGTGETEEVPYDGISYPLPVASDKHSGEYTTHNPTITNMSSVFAYSTSQNLQPYRCEYQTSDMTYNVETGEYGCKDLVLDNEAYNPIKYYINSAFDPRLWLYDELNRQYYRNTKYDPRRVILNTNFNPYKKKWNKWIGDGTTLLADNIMKSELWEMINNGTNKELPAELPVELQSDYINENCPSDLGNDRFETRSYFCPPDLFRYCSNTVNPNVTSAFYYCGGPDYTREGYGEKDYINFGLYGTIPPYLFEPISNVTDLTNIFYYCKGILPYKWPTSTQNGIMYPPQLLTNLTGLKNVSGMFAYGNIYDKCVIEPTQFSKNGELQNVSRLFMNTLWGNDTTLKQLDDGVFTNNKNIKNVSYMLNSGDSHGKNRLPRVVSSGLFTKSNNPKIEDCSYFMTNGQQTSGSVPEFWNWPTITGRTACYRGINTGITNYTSIPDNYK